jgi:hypothetical protein
MSPEPDSAWWLFYERGVDSPNDALVLATTGFFFNRALQGLLSGYNFSIRKAYRAGGPLGGVSVGWGGARGANTDFGNVAIEGKWGPTTNAALWRFIAEQSGSVISQVPVADDFDPITISYLDAIEQSAKDQRLNEKTIEAAQWVITYQGGYDWRRQMAPQSTVGVPSQIAARSVFPQWNESPPRPTRPIAALELRVWPVSENPPPFTSTDDRLPVRSGGGASSSVLPWVAGIGTVALLGGAIWYFSSRSGVEAESSPSPRDLLRGGDEPESFEPPAPPRRPPQTPAKRRTR